MSFAERTERAERYLRELCNKYPDRRVGGSGNLAATTLFSRIVQSSGFAVQEHTFDCVDWAEDGVSLIAGTTTFKACASPYSLGCKASATLAVVSNFQELQECEIQDKILLMRGEIANEQLMPKHFPFYNPEGHQQIIKTLEAKNPLAIVTATPPGAAMVGAAYPSPLFEDGDFDIPSVFMTDLEGERLAKQAGKLVTLDSSARRMPSHAHNLIARKGTGEKRIVFFAHIDSHIGSPGAWDNASGVVTLLLLVEMLKDYQGSLAIELVAMNGEDYYASPGERHWLEVSTGRFDEILLGINVDGVGYRRGRIAYSLYKVPPDIEGLVRGIFLSDDELVEGPAWYQGDHFMFLMNQVPALAFTSELLEKLMQEINHTPDDRPEIVDPKRLVSLANSLRDLCTFLNRHMDSA